MIKIPSDRKISDSLNRKLRLLEKIKSETQNYAVLKDQLNDLMVTHCNDWVEIANLLNPVNFIANFGNVCNAFAWLCIENKMNMPFADFFYLVFCTLSLRVDTDDSLFRNYVHLTNLFADKGYIVPMGLMSLNNDVDIWDYVETHREANGMIFTVSRTGMLDASIVRSENSRYLNYLKSRFTNLKIKKLLKDSQKAFFLHFIGFAKDKYKIAKASKGMCLAYALDSMAHDNWCYFQKPSKLYEIAHLTSFTPSLNVTEIACLIPSMRLKATYFQTQVFSNLEIALATTAPESFGGTFLLAFNYRDEGSNVIDGHGIYIKDGVIWGDIQKRKGLWEYENASLIAIFVFKRCQTATESPQAFAIWAKIVEAYEAKTDTGSFLDFLVKIAPSHKLLRLD